MEADLMGWALEFDQFPKGCTGNLAVQKALHIVEYCVVRYWLLCCVIIMRRPCAASCYEIQPSGNQQNIRAAVNQLIFTIGGNSGGGVPSVRTFPIIRIVMPITLPPDAVLPFSCIRGHFDYYPFLLEVRLGRGAGRQPSLLPSVCTVLPGSGRRFSLRYCAGEQPTRRVNSVIRLLLLG